MAAGILDPTFGNGGTIVHDIDPNSVGDVPVHMSVLPDGKILVAGTRDAYSNSEDFAVVRYLPDGSLDTTFGTAGKAFVDFGIRDTLYGMTVTSTGQIILAGLTGPLGSSSRLGAIARLNADGSLDTSFGVNGKVVSAAGNSALGFADVAVQANGQIIGAGWTNNGRPMVARFNVDGSLDTTFGVDGVAQPLNGTLSARGEIDIEVQADDKIVMSAASYGAYSMWVARFEANGVPDITFDGDGVAGASFGNVQDQGVKDVAIQPDGKIIIVGNRFNDYTNYTADIAVVRFNTNGTLDTNFANGGYFVSNWGSVEDEAIGTIVQADGRIIIVGRRNQDSMIARLTAGGELDVSFGTNGYTVTPLGGLNSDYNDNFVDVDMLPDGRIIALSDAGRNFGLAQYQNTPSYPIPIVGGPYIVGEGGSVTLSGTGTDPNQAANALTYAWDLDGDGIFGEVGANAGHGDETGQTPTFQASGLDGPFTWTIKLRVTNSNGDVNTAQGAVAINNVAPSATLGNNGPVDEGTSATVSFSNGFDYATADASAGFHYAFDYDNNGTWDFGDGAYAGSGTQSSVSVPASYLDDIAPSRTVKGRIIDKDGGTRDYTTTIALNPVNDAPSEIRFRSGQVVLEKSATDALVGSLATIDADLGAEGDTHTYTLIDNAGGRFKIVGNELRVANGSLLDYHANASHMIRVRTTDSHNATLDRDFVIGVLPSQMSYQEDKVETPLSDSASYQLRQAGNEAWFMDADYTLTSNGNYQQNYAGANEKWLNGKTNEFNNSWYIIKPNGELYAWNGNGGAPAGALLKTLEPVYWLYPQLLHNASSENFAYVLDQFLNLRTDNGNLYENYNGLGERWLLGNAGWYYITPSGDLYGSGRLLASLDPIYYQEPARLYNALPSQVAASIAPAQNGNPPKLVIDPVAGYVGDWVVELKSTNGSFTGTTRFEVAVANSVPLIPAIAPKTMPTSQDTLSAPTNVVNNDPGDTVYLSATAGSQAFVIDTLYQLTFGGTAYDNSGGLSERWFQGAVNQHGSRWYFIKPSGEFYAWAGIGMQGTLLETLEPLYHRFPNLLAQAQAQSKAYELDRWVNLYQDASGVWQNWTGQNERWLRGAGGEWYYIKPTGQFYQGDGRLLATFDPVYYTELQRLTSPPANQIAVSISGTNVVVNPATNYVGDVWVLVEASDMPFTAANRRKTHQYFKVTVTA